MNSKQISTVKPGDAADPIEVRVIRKWLSFGRNSECYYLFVDRNEDAIQAIANKQYREHFDALITPQGCYRVGNYICDNAGPSFNVVPHPAALRIGKAATFTPISEDGFPSHYFNFITYDKLRTRLDNHQLLTDFIGKVENIADTVTQQKQRLLKIKIQDPNENFIQAALWEEIAASFDKDVLMRASSPVIVALTSMKVTEFQGVLQLSSTSATYIYLNPDIEEEKSIATKFKEKKLLTSVSTIMYTTCVNMQKESERNRVTIAELLQQKAEEDVGKKFTCIASIASIEERRGWYYKGCTECRKKLQPRGNTLACEDHGDISNPKHFYCLTTTVADNTASTSATFFDEAITSLLQTECVNMVVNEGYTDPYTIPEPMQSIKGQTRIFQLHQSKHSRPGSTRFIVNQMFQISDNITETPTTPLPTMSPLTITSTPHPTTPTSTPTHISTVKRKLLQSPESENDDNKKIKYTATFKESTE